MLISFLEILVMSDADWLSLPLRSIFKSSKNLRDLSMVEIYQALCQLNSLLDFDFIHFKQKLGWRKNTEKNIFITISITCMQWASYTAKRYAQLKYRLYNLGNIGWKKNTEEYFYLQKTTYMKWPSYTTKRYVQFKYRHYNY